MPDADGGRRDPPRTTDADENRHRSSGDPTNRDDGTATHTPSLTRRGALVAGTAALASVAGCTGRSKQAWQLPVKTQQSMVFEMESPKIGRTDGGNPARISVFTDFMCPHCARWNRRILHPIRQELLKPGRAILIHMDFPIPVSERLSWPAAYAGRAVFAEAGSNSFWNFADSVYRQQDDIDSIDQLVKIAGKHGPAPEAVRRKINQQTYYPVVKNNRQTGRQQGVEGTPTVLVDGKIVSNPSAENIIKAVRP